MIKIVRTIQEAVNYCLDNNMEEIDLNDLEYKLINKKVFQSKKYGITFLYDPANVLA